MGIWLVGPQAGVCSERMTLSGGAAGALPLSSHAQQTMPVVLCPEAGAQYGDNKGTIEPFSVTVRLIF
jgi:hypothetical protein